MEFDWDAVAESMPELLQGLWQTLLFSAIAIMAALVLGSLIGALRSANFAPCRLVAQVYIEFMRGIPALVLILICFYVLPRMGLLLDAPTAGLTALTAYYAAYVAEVGRGAIAAVPGGQAEAARAIGMSRLQIFVRVVLPQALGPMLPPLAGLCIGIVKESALLSVISVHEFAFAAKASVSRTYAPFEIYALVALAYWIVNSAIEAAFRFLERRSTRFRFLAAAPQRQRIFWRVA